MSSSPYPDFEDYVASNHAQNQMRKRNIGAFEIKKAFKEGQLDEQGPDPEDNAGYVLEEHQIQYTLKFPGPDLIVIADPIDATIVTVFYNDEQGAVGGAI